MDFLSNYSDFFYTSVKHPKFGNVMQPIIHFLVNIGLIWNHIPDYTEKTIFSQSNGGQFLNITAAENGFSSVSTLFA